MIATEFRRGIFGVAKRIPNISSLNQITFEYAPLIPSQRPPLFSVDGLKEALWRAKRFFLSRLRYMYC